MHHERRRSLAWAMAAIFAAGYLTLLLSNTAYFASGPDTSGYLSEARLLASGRIAAPIEPLLRAKLDPSLAYLFTPYGFARGPEPGTMVPTYPVGTPLHLLAAASIGGRTTAPFLVAPLAAVACLFLIAALARECGLTKEWPVAAAVLLGAYPVFISMALQPMSDVLATMWTLIAVLCALKAPRSPLWVVACSVAFCIGVAVRPASVIVAVPLLAALGLHWRRLAIATMTAIPFAGALMWYHNALYGSPFKTGYGGAGDVISFGELPPCFVPHATALLRIMTPLIVAGLLAAFLRGISLQLRLLLLSWLAVFFVFYSIYSYCPDAAATRFLLPALPPLIVAFLLVVAALTNRIAEEQRAVGRAMAVIAVLIVLTSEVVQIGRMHTLHLNEWESIYPKTVAWVQEQVPKDAIVLSSIVSGTFYYEANRTTIRWDQLDPANAALLRNAPGLQGPWYAVVSEVEGGAAALRARVPGDWEELGRLRDVTLWRLR
ncbi:MAG TPA: hypothetical protein VE010_11870 [Thermoanaerobaculia bacterium]|nr:hypothetical protein [Thermoanaerobaculia bacterium]